MKPERSRKYLALGALAVLVVVLAVSNPSEESFRASLEREARTGSGGLLDRIENRIEAGLTKRNMVYRNYVLFSTVESRVGKTPKRYLGILGNWFQIG